MRTLHYLAGVLCLCATLAHAYVVSASELLDKLYMTVSKSRSLSKAAFYELLRTRPYSIEAFNSLCKGDRIKVYLEISDVPYSKQFSYVRQFTRLEDGDRLLIQGLQNRKNLDDVLQEAAMVTPRRRITNLEKELMHSHNAQRVFIDGRRVIKRDIFTCTPKNIALMKEGKAPIGIDGKKVHLHHLKQQKDGELIELTATEHTKHSNVLHRYVRKGSEISDRNGEFMRFRKKYWQKRSLDCLIRH